MKKGEMVYYYRAKGGERNVYVAMLYHKDKLRGSIIENSKIITCSSQNKKCDIQQ